MLSSPSPASTIHSHSTSSNVPTRSSVVSTTATRRPAESKTAHRRPTSSESWAASHSDKSAAVAPLRPVSTSSTSLSLKGPGSPNSTTPSASRERDGSWANSHLHDERGRRARAPGDDRCHVGEDVEAHQYRPCFRPATKASVRILTATALRESERRRL